jgi:signal transduction histidine kinase/CRP-like cAMP-binding protein/ActR/RegA family two-component response regulator
MYASAQTAKPPRVTVAARIGIAIAMNQLASMTRHAPRQNGLLAALPNTDYERLSGSLELVPLPLGRAVYESGSQLDYAYFPTDCIVSLLSVTQNGSSAEIAIAGNEGLVGIALFMGGETTSSRAVVQNAGYAYRVPAALIKQEFNRGGALQLLLLRYTQALITQMSQTAVCNRHHSLEQQLCRWLLLSVDRLPSNRLEMTEELIANMLGVPGVGVAAAARMLQADGLIQYDRGAITVLDRSRLEKRVCECYAVVKSEFERLLHLPGRAEALQLSGFIKEHMDEIVAEWEAFARTLPPAAATMTSLALRDHARPILQAIANDIQSDQAGTQPLDQSGNGTAATTHGALRHLSGFNLLQLGSEYRALRASVIKLWRSHLAKEHHGALDDLTRFNESVDQALAESIASYADELARSRDTFLAILGHDLRSPLSAVSMSGHYLSRAGMLAGQQELQAVARIQRGAAKMDAMIRDLLEYTKTRLGRGIPIAREACNIGRICEAALDEMKAGHPDRAFRLQTSGELGGSFDSARLQQVVANLLNNAVQHGSRDSPVILEAQGAPDAVTVRVQNYGPLIPSDALQVIFNPLVQVPSDVPGTDDRDSSSLGLGLFIARNIVLGHGGTLEVESSDAAGTVFTARLPRVEPQDTVPKRALRILVVDDNRDTADALAWLLQSIGHEARAAYDGPSALLAAERDSPDMIIQDLGMPHMTGYEIAQRMRKLSAANDTLLVAITGNPPLDALRAVKDAGFDHLLVKPVGLPTLEAVLGTAKRK